MTFVFSPPKIGRFTNNLGVKMNLEIIEESIVILADRHNPSILHPSFLEKQHIIQEGLGLAEPPLTTPDISIAAFSNGLRITVDNMRLQITNHKSSENELDLAGIASAYIKVLPHVEYKSIGSNVFIFIEKEDAPSFLIQKFIKDGCWNSDERLLDSAGFKFVYSENNFIVNLSYDAGKAILSNGFDKEGILIRGNCHKDISSIDDGLVTISHFRKNIDLLVSIVSSTFSE